MSVTSRAEIDRFLGHRRIAMVGASRDPKHFSRMLLKEFRQRGYDVVPVNPNAEEIDGLPSYPSVSALPAPVEGALILTPADRTVEALEDCAKSGVLSVWLYRSVGGGSVSEEATRACERHGMAVVNGECPFMFFPKTQWIHSLHRGFRRLTGSLPN